MSSPTAIATVRCAGIKISVVTLLALVNFGCGGGAEDLSTAPVTGKFTFKGQPVSGGSVTFTPTVGTKDGPNTGKPASGSVGSDGSYALTTYNKDDGAVVGKHRITYSPPAVEFDEKTHSENSKVPTSPYAGLIPKPEEVEVKSGPNTFDIELVPAPAAPNP